MFQASLSVLIVYLEIFVCFVRSTKDDFLPRVVNGRPAKLGDVPYQLAFKQMVHRRSRSYRTFCGGVIIGRSKVLSAAHCFEERGSKCFSRGKVSQRKLRMSIAVAGNLDNQASIRPDSREQGQWRELQSMVYPKRYKFPRDDIAVGFTRRPFEINEYVAPIAYARRFAEYKGECLASGYGRISTTHKLTSDRLLLADLKIVSTSRCSRLHRKNMIKFVCTDITYTDVGQGDSGGPLVCLDTADPDKSSKGILVGIVSGARIRVGTFFTRVSSYSSFIDRGKGTLCTPNIAFICFCLIYDIHVLFLFCFI